VTEAVPTVSRSSSREDGGSTRGRPGGEDDPPPPRREQLPLPRRAQQSHLEPQLRVPGGTGSGTPFAAFAADDDTSEAAASGRHAAEPRAVGPETVEPSTAEFRPAEFQDGTRRGRLVVPQQRTES
jgi:hypothetical protein